MNIKSPSVLLHICCGICAAECVNRLKILRYKVTGFYYNPNIHPEEEYERRKQVVEKIEEIFNIKVIYGEYEPQKWFELCQKYQDEPEGGQRCKLCYEIRLKKTLEMVMKNNFDFFTTTLTISPHKKSDVILSIGMQLDKERFLAIDFKKQDGYKKTIEIAKKFNLYRQNYCGCIYSKNLQL